MNQRPTSRLWILMKFAFFLTLFGPEILSAQTDPTPVLFQLIPDGVNTHLRKWVYIEGDEFEDTDLNHDFWLDSYPWGRSLIGNKELQYYMPAPSNIELSNGLLGSKAEYNPIQALVEPWHSGSDILGDSLPNLRTFDFRSGMVRSKSRYKQGLYWAKIKTPPAQGTWPAFWLYGGGPNEEFDILEGKGERPNQYHVDVHCPSECGNSGSWLNINGNITESFNSYFGEWGPNVVFWYFNNSAAGGALGHSE